VPAGDTRVLLSRPAIDCNSDAYSSLQPLVIAVLLTWIIVLPVGLVWWVHRLHSRDLLRDEAVAHRWGFLYQAYQPALYWIDAALLVRRVLIVCFAVLLVQHGAARTGTLCATLLAFLLLQVWLRPWLNPMTNWWDAAALSSLQLLALLSNDHSIVHDGQYSPAVQALASIIVFGLMGVMLSWLARESGSKVAVACLRRLCPSLFARLGDSQPSLPEQVDLLDVPSVELHSGTGAADRTAATLHLKGLGKQIAADEDSVGIGHWVEQTVDLRDGDSLEYRRLN